MDSFFPACERIISFASGRISLLTEAIHAAITAPAHAGMLQTSGPLARSAFRTDFSLNKGAVSVSRLYKMLKALITGVKGLQI